VELYVGNTTEGTSKKRENDDENRRKNQEVGGIICKNLRGNNTNMERFGRGSRNEGCGRKIKGCTGKGVESFREHKHPSIG